MVQYRFVGCPELLRTWKTGLGESLSYSTLWLQVTLTS